MIYRVKDWDANYENNKSRERNSLSWVPMPNKQSGMGLCKTLTQKDGLSLYGFWSLLVGALSQQRKPRGGWLTHNGHPSGTPWTPSDLAMKFRRSEVEMKRALQWFSSMEIGWMEKKEPGILNECPPDACELPPQEGRKEEKEEKEENLVEIESIIDHLNKKAGTNFRAKSKTSSHIRARLSEGATVDDCKKVIDRKVAEWINDTKMAKYLRPQTLFNAEKFESYLNGLSESRHHPAGGAKPIEGKYDHLG